MFANNKTEKRFCIIKSELRLATYIFCCYVVNSEMNVIKSKQLVCLVPQCLDAQSKFFANEYIVIRLSIRIKTYIFIKSRKDVDILQSDAEAGARVQLITFLYLFGHQALI